MYRATKGVITQLTQVSLIDLYVMLLDPDPCRLSFQTKTREEQRARKIEHAVACKNYFITGPFLRDGDWVGKSIVSVIRGNNKPIV